MKANSSKTPASGSFEKPASGPKGLIRRETRYRIRDFIFLSCAALGCFVVGILLDALLRPRPAERVLLAVGAFAGYLVLGRRALLALVPELDSWWRRDSRRMKAVTVVALVSVVTGRALAQQTPPLDQVPAQPPAAAPTDAGKVAFGGYVEAFYSYNFNTPANRITNFRGFDNRESAFTLSNLDANASWEKGAISGKISLQVGHTPNTYYLSEPAFPGTSATSATDASTWKYVQEAYVGYRAPIRTGILFKGGLFLSPIGVEGIAVKDNWNWSRSNLFFGLPFYHTGVSATTDLSKKWTATLMVCNGWNNVVDNNKDKSVDVESTFKVSDALTAHVLYFGGVERPTDAPEGRPWRNLFDAYATWDATPKLSFILSGDAGFERNHFGTSSWEAGAAYVRVKLSGKVYVAARADVFWEHVPSNSAGTASAIFWPADRVASQTLTLDYHPQDNISIRLEGRHDGATADMYFRDRIVGDGSASNPYIPNARSQTTITLGATTWF